MKKIVQFLQFDDRFPLMENIKMAELILAEDYAKRKKIPTDKVTPQEKIEIEKNPKFVKVKEEFLKKNPRLIFPMTKFYVLEDAPWEEILRIAEKFEKAKLGPKDLKLGPIENYAKVETGDGYKQLDTDIDDALAAKAERMSQPREAIDKKPTFRPEIALLVEEYAKKKKMDPNNVTEEEKLEISKNPKYLELKDKLIGAGAAKGTPHPELMYAYTKFYVIEGTPMKKLIELTNRIEQYKPESDELRQGALDNYARLDPKKHPAGGAETLDDDITEMLKERKAKKMIDAMPKRIRDKYKEVAASDDKKDKERIKKLIYIANRLESLDPKEMEDKITGKPVMRTALAAFIKKSKKYDDFTNRPNRPATYPEYADINFAFDQMIKDGDGEIEGWTSGVDDLRQKLINLEPASAIMYDEDNFIVSSARTHEAMVEVCKIVSGGHCIRNETTFWTYTSGGTVQLNISDFNRKSTDNLALLTLTIKPDGKLEHSAGGNNDMSKWSSFNNKPFQDLLVHLKYPDALIKTAIRFFPEEQRIKAALEKIYRIGSKPETHQILTALTRVHEGVLSGMMSPENWLRICGLVAQIIKVQLKIKDWEFVTYFKENGIVTSADLKIFDYIIGNKYKPEDAKAIKEATEENIEIAEYILGDKASLKTLNKDDIAYFQSMISNKDHILSQVDKL